MDLPIISQADYEAFRNIMGNNLPYTFDEWLNLHAKWCEEYAGDSIRHVRIYADQFARYLDRTGRAPNMNALLRFAEGKAD